MALKLKGRKPGRNDPCICGSGLKYKTCHGSSIKRAICNQIANEKMIELIRGEKRKRGMPIELVCPDCNQIADITLRCEFCNRTGVVTEKQVIERNAELVKENYNELTRGEEG